MSLEEMPGMWEPADPSGGKTDGANAATPHSPVTAGQDGTGGVTDGLKALQRRNADRFGRLQAQGVQLDPAILVDLKLQTLLMMLSSTGTIDSNAFQFNAENLLSDLLEKVEGDLRKACLTQGIQGQLKLR